jgi:uncharacterized protein Yka (UPF0111/DUF47 family)
MKLSQDRTPDLTNLLVQLSTFVADAAQVVNAGIDGSLEFTGTIKKLDNLFNRAAEISQQINALLHRTLIAPYDREDIHNITVALNFVLDRTQAVGRAIISRRVGTPHFAARMLSSLLVAQCGLLRDATVRLARHEIADEDCEQIRHLERKADEMTRSAIADLLESGLGAIEIVKQKDVFEMLSRASAAAASAADAIETMKLKAV